MNLYQRLEYLPVGRKLLLALLVLLLSTLIAANLTFISAAYWISRQSTAPQALHTIARLISSPELVSALKTPEAAKAILQRLEQYSPLRAAVVYTPQGQQLAEFHNGHPLKIPTHVEEVQQWQADGFRVSVLTPLPQEAGYLLLVASSELPEAFYTGILSASLAILLVSLVLWVVVSRQMRRWITKPIRRLEKLSRRVTSEENYALRASPTAPESSDEIAHLANALNTMLSRIEAREHQLKQAYDETQAALDQSETYARQTRESNEQLEQEIKVRHRIEKKLTGFQNYLNNIINSMPSALITADESLRITQWNHQATLLSGTSVEEAANQPLGQAFPALAPFESRIRHAAFCQEVQRVERVCWPLADGLQHHYELTFYPLVGGDGLGVVIRIDEITERIHFEELIVQSEKMRSVGGLAAGMAHEINNPLGAISHNIQNIRRRLSTELEKNQEAAQQIGLSLTDMQHYLNIRQIPQILERIQLATNRAACIVTHMLGFTRMSNRQHVDTSLPALIEQALSIADNDFDLTEGFDFRAIQILRDFDPDLEQVPCISNELEQVLLNLLKNAAQAIHQRADRQLGRIVLRTRRHPPWAEIQVEDNGGGMPEAVRQRIFEPFFTTKDVGQGTGLGLFVSYFIITNNHKGQMEVQSTLGQGSLFTIRLPLIHNPASD